MVKWCICFCFVCFFFLSYGTTRFSILIQLPTVLMQSVRDDIEKEHHAIQNSDILIFFQVAQFVTSFQYHKFLNQVSNVLCKWCYMVWVCLDICKCAPYSSSYPPSLLVTAVARNWLKIIKFGRTCSEEYLHFEAFDQLSMISSDAWLFKQLLIPNLSTSREIFLLLEGEHPSNRASLGPGYIVLCCSGLNEFRTVIMWILSPFTLLIRFWMVSDFY